MQFFCFIRLSFSATIFFVLSIILTQPATSLVHIGHLYRNQLNLNVNNEQSVHAEAFILQKTVNDFPCIHVAEHAMHPASQLLLKIHNLLLNSVMSVCSKHIQSKYFAVQTRWMKSFHAHMCSVCSS